MDLPSTLIIGYGNPDRQDDGIAWHILGQLAAYFKIESTGPDFYDFLPQGNNPDLLFTLQLTPEIAETIARYDRVFFIDAHTGDIKEDICVQELSAEFQNSPLTHHMTPQTLMSLVETLYQRKPGAILISIRGYEFGFARSLSQKTMVLSQSAVQRIIAWFQTHG